MNPHPSASPDRKADHVSIIALDKETKELIEAFTSFERKLALVGSDIAHHALGKPGAREVLVRIIRARQKTGEVLAELGELVVAAGRLGLIDKEIMACAFDHCADVADETKKELQGRLERSRAERTAKANGGFVN